MASKWQKLLSQFSDKFMEKKIKTAAENFLKILGIFDCSLEIFLVPDSIMRDINREYRGKDKATNVLSFEAAAMPCLSKAALPLGTIYLAPKYITDHNEDIRYLLLHGILHLLGYTHEQGARKAKAMEQKEKEVISKARF